MKKQRLLTSEQRRERRIAMAYTKRLVLAGVLVKPERCEGCDEPDTVLMGYHPVAGDFRIVEWLCPKCLCIRRTEKVREYADALPKPAPKPLVTLIRAHRCVQCILANHGTCQRPGPAAGLPQDDRCRCACQRSPEPGKYVEPPNAQRVGKVPGQPSFKTLSPQSRKHRCLVCKSGNHEACVGYSGEGLFATKCRCECRRVVAG